MNYGKENCILVYRVGMPQLDIPRTDYANHQRRRDRCRNS